MTTKLIEAVDRLERAITEAQRALRAVQTHIPGALEPPPTCVECDGDLYPSDGEHCLCLDCRADRLQAWAATEFGVGQPARNCAVDLY